MKSIGKAVFFLKASKKSSAALFVYLESVEPNGSFRHARGMKGLTSLAGVDACKGLVLSTCCSLFVGEDNNCRGHRESN